VRVALVASVTLLLGLGIGASLSGVPGWFGASTGALTVRGAERLVVDCDPFEYGGDQIDLSSDVTCRVTATMPDGTTVEGDLDGSLTGRYLCGPEEGGLRCSER
jgi:hypothetical protein